MIKYLIQIKSSYFCKFGGNILHANINYEQTLVIENTLEVYLQILQKYHWNLRLVQILKKKYL